MPSVKKPIAVKAAKAKSVKGNKNAGPVVSGQLKKKLQKRKPAPKNLERGIVLVKHLPHGFFEEQLKNYFKQFGTVTRIRLARSTRTGVSRGFAYIEFEYPEVAKVAAETMDNYLMFKKVVKAAYIPPEAQKFNYFKTTVRKVKNDAGKEIYVSGKTQAIQRRIKEQNDWSDDTYQKRTATTLKKYKKLQKKYGHLDLDLSKVLLGYQEDDSENTTENVTKEAATKGKRKDEAEMKTDIKQKKSKQDIKLEDLLGNTLNDDTDDEDYDFISDADSDEYDEADFTGTSDDEEEEEEENEEEEEMVVVRKPKGKKHNDGIDRLDKLIKRKPQTGGVKKRSQKIAKKEPISKVTKSLKMAAAKELAKPLTAQARKAIGTKAGNKKVK